MSEVKLKLLKVRYRNGKTDTFWVRSFTRLERNFDFVGVDQDDISALAAAGEIQTSSMTPVFLNLDDVSAVFTVRETWVKQE